MYKVNTIILFIYLAIMFLVLNKFSKILIEKNWGKFWTKRIYLVPIGLIICTLIIALTSWLLPPYLFLFIITPVLFLFIGLIAHSSYKKVAEYQQLAEEKSGYGSMKKKK